MIMISGPTARKILGGLIAAALWLTGCAAPGDEGIRRGSELREAIAATLSSTNYRVVVTRGGNGETREQLIERNSQGNIRQSSNAVISFIQIGRDQYGADESRDGRFQHDVSLMPVPNDIATLTLRAIAKNGRRLRYEQDVFRLVVPLKTSVEVTLSNRRVHRVTMITENYKDTFLFIYQQDVAPITPPPDELIVK